ncbi:hypothetical protein [Helicobacter felis]|uniref:hypothetical protein n=1 Tax=Helicobacter felis TaxID=214 RepID=UPI00196A0351|nr:hypothetical protein [Helicobacter felis]
MFRRTIQDVLSAERLKSYTNMEEHFRNLQLIAKITPHLATIEICLRNILDIEMKKKNQDWIRQPLDESEEDKKVAMILEYAKIEVEKREKKGKRVETDDEGLKHSQYLSRFSFGTIIHIIKESKLQSEMLDLSSIDFNKYDKSNANNAYLEQKRNIENLNAHKVDVVLNLLQTTRNRCYHWENILKVRYGKRKGVFPRITTWLRGVKIGLNPMQIEVFLEDLLETIHPELNTRVQEPRKSKKRSKEIKEADPSAGPER